MVRIISIVTLAILLSLQGFAQEITAMDLLEKSRNYHDPKALLSSSEVILSLKETRPEGADRLSVISFNIAKEYFRMERNSEGVKILGNYNKGAINHSVDGRLDYSEEEAKKYRLSEERLVMMRSYYQYLWLLPMKLSDPGTIVDPAVKEIDFFGQNLLQVKVDYEKGVGDDVWYFYFDPKTYAMKGYRFYHDESVNDGEYILLEGETSFRSVRLPKSRAWYMHKDDKYLGSDILEKLQIDNP